MIRIGKTGLGPERVYHMKELLMTVDDTDIICFEISLLAIRHCHVLLSYLLVLIWSV